MRRFLRKWSDFVPKVGAGRLEKGQNSRDMMKRKNTLHSLSVKRNKRIGGRGLVGNEIKTSYIVEMRSRPRI